MINKFKYRISDESKIEQCILWIEERYNKDFFLTRDELMKEYNDIIGCYRILTDSPYECRDYDNKVGKEQIVLMSKWIIEYYDNYLLKNNEKIR